MIKETVTPGDVVIIYHNNLPADFVHVVNIEANHKKGFWNVSFLRIGFPSMTWIWELDTEQLQGETFTMNNVPCRIQVFSRPSVAIKGEKKVEKLETLLSKVTETNKHPNSFL